MLIRDIFSDINLLFMGASFILGAVSQRCLLISCTFAYLSDYIFIIICILGNIQIDSVTFRDI